MTDVCIPIKGSHGLSCISIIHLPAISREDVLVAVVPVPVHNLACRGRRTTMSNSLGQAKADKLPGTRAQKSQVSIIARSLARLRQLPSYKEH